MAEDRLRAAGEQLLCALERAAAQLDAGVRTCKEKEKTDSGEILREYSELLPEITGPVDRGGLKQLTGVLKDLQEILLASPMDNREQALRLSRLESELSGSSGIRVTLAEEVEALGL